MRSGSTPAQIYIFIEELQQAAIQFRYDCDVNYANSNRQVGTTWSVKKWMKNFEIFSPTPEINETTLNFNHNHNSNPHLHLRIHLPIQYLLTHIHHVLADH